MPHNDVNKTSHCKNELQHIKKSIAILEYCSNETKITKLELDQIKGPCNRDQLGFEVKKIANSAKLLPINSKLNEFKKQLHDEVISLLDKKNKISVIKELDNQDKRNLSSPDAVQIYESFLTGSMNVLKDHRPLEIIFESDWVSSKIQHNITYSTIPNAHDVGFDDLDFYKLGNHSLLNENRPFSFLKNSSPKELCLADINSSSAKISTPSAGVSIKETNAVSTSGSMFSDTTEPNLAPPLNKGQIQTNGYLISLGLGAIGGVLDEVSEIMLNILERKNCSKKTIRCVATVLAFANSFAITTLPFIYNIMQVLDNDDDAVNNSKKVMELTLTFFISALVSNCVFQGLKQGLNRCSKAVSNKTIKFLLSVLPCLGYLWMVANGENTLEGFAIAGSSLIVWLQESSQQKA